MMHFQCKHLAPHPSSATGLVIKHSTSLNNNTPTFDCFHPLKFGATEHMNEDIWELVSADQRLVNGEDMGSPSAGDISGTYTGT